MQDYEKTYEDFWKHFVETDGVLNIDQVKRELHDYHTLLENVPKVYVEVTGGRIGKPLTEPECVIAEYNDVCQQEVDEAVEEALKEAKQSEIKTTTLQEEFVADGKHAIFLRRIPCSIPKIKIAGVDCTDFSVYWNCINLFLIPPVNSIIQITYDTRV